MTKKEEDIIFDIALDVKKNKREVKQTIDFFFKTVGDIIKSEDNRTIKIDYFGKLTYNSVRAAKIQKKRDEHIQA
jgi:nucleoid DNA-binding protein